MVVAPLKIRLDDYRYIDFFKNLKRKNKLSSSDNPYINHPPLKAVLGIRICRIGMFLGLLDPDPLVIDTDPALPFSHKGVEQTEIMLEK